jgi:hypothetical protein
LGRSGQRDAAATMTAVGRKAFKRRWRRRGSGGMHRQREVVLNGRGSPGEESNGLLYKPKISAHKPTVAAVDFDWPAGWATCPLGFPALGDGKRRPDGAISGAAGTFRLVTNLAAGGGTYRTDFSPGAVT